MPTGLEPWNDERGIDWINGFDPWEKMTRLVYKTLMQDPFSYPHEIRAAASMVIMFCRHKLWPGDIEHLDKVVGLAKRQLGVVKQMYAHRSRENPALVREPGYRQLLDSLDQEMRILESRMSDPPLNIPQEPPATWGDFWDWMPP